jgi:hypothetical protein
MIDTKEERRKERAKHEKRTKRYERNSLIWVAFWALGYPWVILLAWWNGSSAWALAFLVVLDALMIAFTAYMWHLTKRSNIAFLAWLTEADKLMDQLEDEFNREEAEWTASMKNWSPDNEVRSLEAPK